ncbi:MAG: ThuA domain-containing protein [Verrucomicrobia bacterium]|nr:ThuA domain-containing protein [Verrucomicrobiota bacterium]
MACHLRCLVVLGSALTLLLAGMVRAADPEPWLTYPGKSGPGRGKRVVLIAADQEYRSEHAMPMLARILSTHHGFDCTVLFGVNEKGEVDPTLPVYPEEGRVFREHHIPGLERLAQADLVLFFPRLLTLPMRERQLIVDYIDSGRPILSLRTGNHGFHAALPYRIDGRIVDWGNEVLGGGFMNHHGQWQADSTRGVIVEAMKDHPILRGVRDIWGPSDVYRTYKEGGSLPAGSTALVWGQPLLGRKPTDRPNPDLEPLPVAWFKHWKTRNGRQARVFQSTMGSAQDLECADLRRLVINAIYWGLGMESAITPDRSVDLVGPYAPPESGFHYAELGVVPRPVSAFR